MRRRTHTSFVGEQAALGTLADGSLNACAKGTAQDGLRLESILEDHAERSGQILDAGNQDHQASQQEDGSHNRHQLFTNSCQALHTAQENDTADNYQNDTNDPGRNAKGRLKGRADGIGLHHASHEAQSQNDGNREETGQEFTKTALKSGSNVINRTAVDRAVFVNNAGLLCQSCLRINRSHAQECDDPHPEDGAGAAGQDGAGCANDVTGTHLGRNGSRQSLERGHAALLLTAPQGQITKDLLHALAKAANLDKTGLNGIPQTDRHQQNDQDIAGQIVVDVTYDWIQSRFQICEHSVFPS